MNQMTRILKGISNGDTIGGPYAMATIVANVCKHDTFDLQALEKAYFNYYQSGSFDSGPCFRQVHQLMEQGKTRKAAVEQTHRLFKQQTAGCNPMHRFAVVAGTSIPYEELDKLARADAKLTHFDEVAGISSSVCVRLLRRIIDGQKLNEAYSTVLKELSSSEREQSDVLPTRSGYAPAVLAAAISFADDVAEGLSKAIHYAGTNNYCPPITGALIETQLNWFISK